MTRLQVRVIPRAGNDRLQLLPDGSLRAHLTAPPIDGRANESLERLLARVIGVPPRNVRVVRGATARAKTVEVDGLDANTVKERLQHHTTP